MTIWQHIAVMTLMSVVFGLAILFSCSNDPRNQALGIVVIFVYITVGVFHAAKLTRK